MKPSLLLMTVILVCVSTLKSQEVPIPDSLTGTWKYKGPSHTSINDTIELEKIVIKDHKYELWTFRPYRNKLEITFKSTSDATNSIISTKTDNTWFYDNKSKVLAINISDYNQQFKIISYQYPIIKLIKIK